jgi:hypothetical protein
MRFNAFKRAQVRTMRSAAFPCTPTRPGARKCAAPDPLASHWTFHYAKNSDKIPHPTVRLSLPSQLSRFEYEKRGKIALPERLTLYGIFSTCSKSEKKSLIDCRHLYLPLCREVGPNLARPEELENV